MECPHCQKELPALPCATCGQAALPGAAFCHHCGHELPAPAGQPPKLLTCHSCGQAALPGAAFCHHCGQEVDSGTPAEEGAAPLERIACSDGMCIGIIGPDGRCTECGQPPQPAAGQE